jgi:hypothetical protein
LLLARYKGDAPQRAPLYMACDNHGYNVDYRPNSKGTIDFATKADIILLQGARGVCGERSSSLETHGIAYKMIEKKEKGKGSNAMHGKWGLLDPWMYVGDGGRRRERRCMRWDGSGSECDIFLKITSLFA